MADAGFIRFHLHRDKVYRPTAALRLSGRRIATQSASREPCGQQSVKPVETDIENQGQTQTAPTPAAQIAIPCAPL
jgi:hypothetical protein